MQISDFSRDRLKGFQMCHVEVRGVHSVHVAEIFEAFAGYKQDRPTLVFSWLWRAEGFGGKIPDAEKWVHYPTKKGQPVLPFYFPLDNFEEVQAVDADVQLFIRSHAEEVRVYRHGFKRIDPDQVSLLNLSEIRKLDSSSF